MSEDRALHQLLDAAVSSRPDHVALEEPESDGRITYRDLGALSDQIRDRLILQGVGRGDRVGIYMRKSIDAVASIFGVMKAGAAYVPVDPAAPATRNAFIFQDCGIKAAILESRFEESLRAKMNDAGSTPMLSIDAAGDGSGLESALAREQRGNPAPEATNADSSDNDLAYVLYTSGSTGKPKGVMLTHRNALSFIDWCSEVFEPREDDRFSSHAPLHFDLSILDLYLPVRHGASLVIIGHESSKEPGRLASLISERAITNWYSAPSILSLMAEYGKLEEKNFEALRMILFAGEVFPIKHLRLLKNLIPQPRYFNLYGPTETNVCTYYEIPELIPKDRTDAYPIGAVCSHLDARVIDSAARDTSSGEEGELCIRGSGVTQGYWNLPEQTRNAFVTDGEGHSWYRTGDLVVEDDDHQYVYHGRLDRMVKKRGYRVELGEIESCLYEHPSVQHAAVIALSDEGDGVRIKAFVSVHEGEKRSIIALKRFCSEHIPLYMVPDVFSFPDSIPLTSTDKIDYQALKDLD